VKLLSFIFLCTRGGNCEHVPMPETDDKSFISGNQFIQIYAIHIINPQSCPPDADYEISKGEKNGSKQKILQIFEEVRLLLPFNIQTEFLPIVIKRSEDKRGK
jgi:hypothetical protein